MNVIDKCYEMISPERALKREAAKLKLGMVKQMSITNSGYDESGASKRKHSMKGWQAESKGAFEDIDLNLDILRQRSRSLFMNAPIATSAIKTTRTNVVGAGLKLKSRVDFNILGMTQQEADLWEKKVEQEFNLWSESKFCDALGLNNFYELQQIAMMSWLLNGDSFSLIRHDDPKPYMPYGMKLFLIDGDRVCNPKASAGQVDDKVKAKNGNRILNGVEINQYGQVIAYHICNSNPRSKTLKKEWQRVTSIGANTGLPNILHVMEAERPEQYRGVPYLAPVIESLKQLTRYTEAELMAAVINGFFTVFIKTESPEDTDEDFSGLGGDSGVPLDTPDYRLGPGQINLLGPGESIEIADSKRPNVNFDGFVSAMCKYVGAALEIPYELLIKSFTASYSASRAALMEAWKAFKMRRNWFASDFCQPAYELWLSEAIARGRIKAPGFFNDPLIRKAYCKAEWNGPAPGQLDPVKEVNAAEKRINLGISTREREAIEINSSNFDTNVEQLKLEAKKMKDIRMEEGEGL
ncbi:MAG: phage portal protein [Cellulosilyticaceae bacterium]